MEITIRKPWAFSEIGRKDNQEDYIYPAKEKLSVDDRFFILCDGMGGHEHGEIASQTVAEALGKYFRENKPSFGIATNDYFNAALQTAYDELDKVDTGGEKKMGTTLTCVYLHAKGCMVAHIGDSRIYHIRPSIYNKEAGINGIMYQSSDHSLVNDLLKVGELTSEEAENFPQKNIITRAMQPNLETRSRADIFQLEEVEDGDYFFLCCDGIMEQLTNDKLCSILADKSLDDKAKLDAIHEVCYDKTRDNFTCILIPIGHVKQTAIDKDVSDSEEIIQCQLEEEPTIVPAQVPTSRVPIASEPPAASKPKQNDYPPQENQSLLLKFCKHCWDYRTHILTAIIAIAVIAFAVKTFLPNVTEKTPGHTPDLGSTQIDTTKTDTIKEAAKDSKRHKIKDAIEVESVKVVVEDKSESQAETSDSELETEKENKKSVKQE